MDETELTLKKWEKKRYSFKKPYFAWKDTVLAESFIREIKTYVDTKSISTILVAGCGHGWSSKILSKLFPCADVINLDICQNNLQAMLKFQNQIVLSPMLVHCDWDFLPFKNDIFDLILMFNSFHHSLDLFITSKECIRVLTNKGLFLAIKEMIIPLVFSHYYKQKHSRIFTSLKGIEGAHTYKHYKNKLSKAGYSQVTIKTSEINYNKLVYPEETYKTFIKNINLTQRLPLMLLVKFFAKISSNFCREVLTLFQIFFIPLWGVTILAKK